MSILVAPASSSFVDLFIINICIIPNPNNQVNPPALQRLEQFYYTPPPYMSRSIYGLSDGWMAVCSFILCPSECLSVCLQANIWY